MIKRNKIMVALAGVALMTATSCTTDFDRINTDPNAPTSASVILLLNPQLRSLAQGQFQYDTGACLAHQVAKTNYNDAAQYNFGSSEGTWNGFYSNLVNIQDMIQVAENNSQPSSVAIGYILKAFCASQLTDHWGNVPYSEALQGGTNIHPKYDLQSDIYTGDDGIISLLSKADEILASNSDNIPADIIYGGDRTKWRKFGNSLRLRYLMRISNRRNEITSFSFASQLADCLSKPLMESNDDNFELAYLDGTPNRCPIYELRSGEFDYLRLGNEMAQQLNSTSDPRREVWFQPSAASVEAGNPQYIGIPCGCNSTTLSAQGYNESNVSMLGTIYRNTPNSVSAVLMNAAEVKFLQAEAVVRGWTSGDAAKLYDDGIRLSMAQYGISDSKVETYLSQPGVAYDASNGLAMIMEQKWLANFMVGFENWFDFLRTGLPKQTMPLDNRNPTETGGIPSRYYYPENEQAVNKAQYDAAVELEGGSDDINTKLWWE